MCRWCAGIEIIWVGNLLGLESYDKVGSLVWEMFRSGARGKEFNNRTLRKVGLEKCAR